MVLVAGESLIDMIPSSGPEGAPDYRAVPGGSPYNVAIALGRAGLRPLFLCGFGSDRFGDLLLDRLKASDVDPTFCLPSQRLTTLGFVSKGASGDPQYAFYTEGTAGCEVSKNDIPALVPDRIRALHFGSFSLAVEPFGGALEELCCREAGERLISIDPNIRPFLVSDRSAYEQRLSRMLNLADVIKVSDEDLAWLRPGTDPIDYARERLNLGAALVVVTRGGAGAVAVCGGGEVEVAGESVEVVDTVGAGDTFQANLLVALFEAGLLEKAAIRDLDTETLERALRLAGRAAAMNCGRQGCDPPRRSELGSW